MAGVEQDDEGVTVALADGEQLRSRYLVGCDGGRSTVRKLLGVGFPGEPARTGTLMGEMEVGVAQEEIAAAVADISETHKRFWLRPVRGGIHSVVVLAAGVGDRAKPPTLEDFTQHVRSIAGTDFGVHSPRWLARFGVARPVACEAARAACTDPRAGPRWRERVTSPPSVAQRAHGERDSDSYWICARVTLIWFLSFDPQSNSCSDPF